MRKIYRYEDLSFPVADDEEVKFTVRFISDGNIASTFINVPGPDDKEIVDEGTEGIGQGSELRDLHTFVVSDINNIAPEEDEIIVQYLVNDNLLVEHFNLKAESERPFVILIIDFPAS